MSFIPLTLSTDQAEDFDVDALQRQLHSKQDALQADTAQLQVLQASSILNDCMQAIAAVLSSPVCSLRVR